VGGGVIEEGEPEANQLKSGLGRVVRRQKKEKCVPVIKFEPLAVQKKKIFRRESESGDCF